MRSKSLQRSAWLGLACVLLIATSNGAAAGNAPVTNTGSTVVLRLKGAIDALFEPIGSRKASDRARLRSRGDYIDLGPLE